MSNKDVKIKNISLLNDHKLGLVNVLLHIYIQFHILYILLQSVYALLNSWSSTSERRDSNEGQEDEECGECPPVGVSGGKGRATTLQVCSVESGARAAETGMAPTQLISLISVELMDDKMN